jgi:hypothetical protein
MNTDNQIGVLYIVFDDAEMLEECVFSASSLSKHSPGIPARLITNLSPALIRSGVFDQVDYVSDSTHPLKAKVKYLSQTRFERTLFLDADTQIKADIRELFDSLRDHDIAVTRDNHCDWESKPVTFIRQESDDINTGMILYRKSDAVMALFDEWLRLIMPQNETVMRPGVFRDQWYFNRFLKGKVLSGDTLKTKLLSNEVYNVRPWCWKHLKRQKKFGRVKILHAHHLHHGFFTKLKRKLRSLF